MIHSMLLREEGRMNHCFILKIHLVFNTMYVDGVFCFFFACSLGFFLLIHSIKYKKVADFKHLHKEIVCQV